MFLLTDHIVSILSRNLNFTIAKNYTFSDKWSPKQNFMNTIINHIYTSIGVLNQSRGRQVEFNRTYKFTNR